MTDSNSSEFSDGIAQLFAGRGARFLIRRLSGDDDGEDEYLGGEGNRNGQQKCFQEVTEPQPIGQQLLHGGEFGRLGPVYGNIRSSTKRGTLEQKLRASELMPGTVVREDVARVSAPNVD